MKKIAVIGAGFSGLAVSWHLQKIFPNSLIDLFDKNPIGENTSGASTGLLNGFVGRYAKKSLYADHAIESALPLLNAAQRYVHEKIYSQNGLFRIALDQEQEEIFSGLAKRHSEVDCLSKNQASNLLSNLINHSGIFIKNALSVNPIKYLKGLFLDLQAKGVQFFQKNVNNGDLQGYDIRVFCTGHDIVPLDNLFSFKYEKIKGQMLICRWPGGLPKLKLSVCGDGHITLFDKICYLGSTYEHSFDNERIDEKAYELIDRIKAFFPLVEKLEIIGIKAGVRIKRKGHYFPYVGRVDDKSFIFSCLGSRGLLYHSYLAEKLALAIKYDNYAHLPKECLAPN